MYPDVTPELTVVAEACSTLITPEPLGSNLPLRQLPVSLNKYKHLEALYINQKGCLASSSRDMIDEHSADLRATVLPADCYQAGII